MSRRKLLFGGVLLVVLAGLACASPPQKVRFESVPPAREGTEFRNWPYPPAVDYAAIEEIDGVGADVVSAKGAGGGVTGAMKMRIRFPSFDEGIDLKVKPIPRSLDGPNNSPRKEIASFQIQRLFLDPVDYVVPTTAVLCEPVAEWPADSAAPKPQVPEADCILVMIALWMQELTLPDPLWDRERFLEDGRYAYYLANFNVFTHLVDHKDNRQGNFLVSNADDDRRVFAIDNGTTFGAWLFNYFYPPNAAWRHYRLSALPRTTFERLRALDRSDLDFLAVVAQLELNEKGVLRNVPPGAPIDPDRGATWSDGVLQLGLTASEIDSVWERIEGLVRAVGEGRLELF